MKTIFSEILVFFLKVQILVISYCFHTRFYLVFVLLGILGSQCDVSGSNIQFFSEKIVVFVLLSSLFFSILLNFPFFGESAQLFIGKPFLNRYLPGPLKGMLPFAFLLLTLTSLAWFESYTLMLRVADYNSSIDIINQSLESAAKKPWGEDFLKELQATDKSIYHLLPPEYPSRGVLKDFSKIVITFIEGKQPKV